MSLALRTKYLLLLIFLLSSQAFADIAVQNEYGGTTEPVSVTVGAGSDLGLVCSIVSEVAGGAVQPTGIVFNTSEALTSAADSGNIPGGTDIANASIWYLANPSVTTADVDVTFASAPATFYVHCYVLTDFAQSSIVADFDTDGADGDCTTEADVALTEVDGGFGVAAYVCAAGAQTVTWTDFNEDFDSGTTATKSGAAAVLAGTDAITPGATASGGTQDAAIAGVIFNQAVSAPAFDTPPAFSSSTDTAITISYNADAVADNIQCMLLSTAEATPTAAAIEAQTGSNGYATEASTAGADTLAITATDSPEFPRYNVHCALEDGTSNYSAVSTVSAAVMADPTGEQFIAITSIGAASPCASFNTAVNPDIANGDFLLANDNVDPGAVAVTIGADCQYSYAASGRQSVLNTEVYDASVGAYHASDIDAWFNNSAPLCINIAEPFVWTIDEAITAFDLDTYCTDADTEQSTYTVTTGTLPTGVSLTAGTGAISGTPTVEDEDGVEITFTATDIPGDTDTFTSIMYVIDTVTLPDLSDDDLNTAIADMNALRPWLDFGDGISVTFSCDVEDLEQVVSQDPAANTEITATEEISLVVSLGSCATSKRTSEMRLTGIRIGL